MHRLWVVAAAVALCAVACGTPTAATTSPSPTPPPTSSPSQSPSPLGQVFKLAPEPGVTASGMITLTTGSGTVSLELKITGLGADSHHVSHIHLGSCQTRGGIAFSLNPVVADGQGAADTKTTLSLTYPPSSGTWYVVVHAGPDMVGASANYLLCGNLFA
ncbi:MAG TPA: CHRD domain-containing protein [Candidatus Limnocylindrales bacterium]|nr:CHRD domain-containing protein [Candidatus Limnocylindrales bacterium]